LKLANPIGVGQALAKRYASIADERLQLLREDLSLLEDIDRQLAVYRQDLARGFELRMSAVEKVLVEMESRGHAYFEDTLRIGRVMGLLNRSRIPKEFESRVVSDAPRQIERRVTELIDWLIDQDFRQWQAITARLAELSREHGSRALGAPDVGRFHADRSHLIDSVGKEAQRVVETYDKEREAGVIADHARAAVTTAAAAGGAAVGLGTLVTLVASTAAADVTGILMAGFIAALGFLVIPAHRKKAKQVAGACRYVPRKARHVTPEGSMLSVSAVGQLSPSRRSVRALRASAEDAGAFDQQRCCQCEAVRNGDRPPAANAFALVAGGE
jgi:hypothetical protein